MSNEGQRTDQELVHKSGLELPLTTKRGQITQLTPQKTLMIGFMFLSAETVEPLTVNCNCTAHPGYRAHP